MLFSYFNASFLAFFFLTTFVMVALFVDLTLLFFFCMSKKNPKTHKKYKISKKFDHLYCVISHVEFGLVPSYQWRSAYTSLACYVCIFSV